MNKSIASNNPRKLTSFLDDLSSTTLLYYGIGLNRVSYYYLLSVDMCEMRVTVDCTNNITVTKNYGCGKDEDVYTLVGTTEFVHSILNKRAIKKSKSRYSSIFVTNDSLNFYEQCTITSALIKYTVCKMSYSYNNLFRNPNGANSGLLQFTDEDVDGSTEVIYTYEISERAYDEFVKMAKKIAKK